MLYHTIATQILAVHSAGRHQMHWAQVTVQFTAVGSWMRVHWHTAIFEILVVSVTGLVKGHG